MLGKICQYGIMPLDRTALVTAAFELLDEDGLEAVTLRRLAAKLHIQAPSIYWHFKNKQELLDEMSTSVIKEFTLNLKRRPAMRWQRFATLYGERFRQALLAHRDGARMASGTRLTDPTLFNEMEKTMQFVMAAGFTRYMTIVMLTTLYSYVIGFVIEEQAVYPHPGQRDPSYDLQRRSKLTESNTLVEQSGEDLFSNFDRRFADGLAAIIEGFAHSR